MKAFNKYGYNTTSQNGEDGIIKECLNRITPELKVSVEFGGANGFFCSNTAQLRDGEWRVYMYDLEANDLVYKKEINPGNVNELPECSVLSIDIDGNDFSVWKAYNGKPDIVIIEINSSLQPDVEFFHPDRGASFCTMNRLAEEKGYFLLCHTGNCIYVLNKYRELFPEAEFAYFKNDWL